MEHKFNAEVFEMIVTKLQMIAWKILPKASEDPDPTRQMIGSLGAIPDTFEWFNLKISCLDRNDVDGLYEWQRYLKEKMDKSNVAKANQQ